MGIQHFKNISIRGISACVPKNKIENSESALLESPAQISKFIETTGVERRRSVIKQNICTSDLCFEAADRLIVGLGWPRESIDCLLFVSQTPDYIMPATSCILQDKLGLSEGCLAMDISLGCSGWIHGVITLSSLIQNGYYKRGILLSGDTSTVTKSPKDKSTFPLFGDGGTATAIEYVLDAEGIKVHNGTDGKNFKAIYIPDGGFRNFFSVESLEEKIHEGGIIRTNLDTVLDGPAVFTFGIARVPQSINTLLTYFNIDKEDIDFFVLHQANKMLNETIRKKLKLPSEKFPYSIHDFGNTSSSSIPLTIVTQLGNLARNGSLKIVASGFGVGLSWGSIHFVSEKICVPPLMEL